MKLRGKILIDAYNIDIVLLVLTLTVVVFFTILGFWQLGRLKDKNELISRVQANLELAPKDLSEIKQEELLYAKVRLKGKFLEAENIYLYGRRSGMAEKDGYYLVSPFETVNNKIIMVARGWFSHSNKEVVNGFMAGRWEEPQTISGIILPGENRKFLVPENDVKNQVWFTLDLSQASSVLNKRVENFYLIKIGNPEFPPLGSLSERNILKIRNDHLEYAITWFSLAVALLVIFGLYTHKASKR